MSTTDSGACRPGIPVRAGAEYASAGQVRAGDRMIAPTRDTLLRRVPGYDERRTPTHCGSDMRLAPFHHRLPIGGRCPRGDAVRRTPSALRATGWRAMPALPGPRETECAAWSWIHRKGRSARDRCGFHAATSRSASAGSSRRNRGIAQCVDRPRRNRGCGAGARTPVTSATSAPGRGQTG